MRTRTLLSLLLAIIVPVIASAQTAADKLRDLDRLHAEGLISDEVYNEQWKQIVADAIKSPAKPVNATIPKLNLVEPAKRFEIAFAGSYQSIKSEGSDVRSFAFNGSLGYYTTDRLEFVFGVEYLKTDGDGDDVEAEGASLGVDYHLSNNRSPGATVPYVGAAISGYHTKVDESTDDDWAWDVHVGIKQYVGRDVLVKAEVSYRRYENLDLDGVTATIGVGFRF